MTMHHEEPLSPRQKKAQELVSGLSRPPADAAFRARLKEEFVSGAIVQREGTSRFAARRPRRGWTRWAAPLAAAAALVLMFSWLNRGPVWTLVEGEGTAHIDGVEVSMADVAAVNELLHDGVRVEMDEGARACFLQKGIVLAEVSEGSTVRLPDAPGRWVGRTMEAEVEMGAVRWITGPRFPGTRLRVDTIDSRIEVVGTCFTVVCDEDGTHVCVLDGKVEVQEKKGPTDVVVGGKRAMVFRNEAAATTIGPILESERVELTRLMAMASEVMDD